MATNMKFGECLRYLLTILEVSIVKLSKVINVDNSLVNRWVNEKRTPAYNTGYIEKISEYLSGCILNSFQMRYLDELFLKVCGDCNIEIEPKEKIKKILFQSQGYSIECRKKIAEENKTHNSVDIHQHYLNQSTNTNINVNLLNIQDSDFSINLSIEDKILIGCKNILAASISLLEDTSNHICNNDMIYISFNENMLIYIYYNDLIRFRNAMLKAINNGWNIQFLLKINSNINSIINFINFAQPLTVTGKFHPYYYKKYSHTPTYQEFIVIPRVGALLGLSNNIHSKIDTAFYFSNKVAVNILKNMIDTIINSQIKSLVKYYEPDNAIDYSNFLAEQEDVIGNRIMYKRDFSILIFPKNLYNKLLQRKNINSDETNTSLEFYNRRLKAFLSNINKYKYTDIYHIDCINNLIKHGEFNLYLYNKVITINLEVADVIIILKNIVTLLKKNKNYNIAFISQNNNISNLAFYCMLKERTAIIMETYDCAKDIPLLRLSIKEPIFVKAFEAYFNEVLEQIAPINKDKKGIINWIERHINLLENHH